MNPLLILQTVSEVISLLDTASTTASDAALAYNRISTLFDKTAAQTTQADLDSLEADITALSERLQKPLGPEPD